MSGTGERPLLNPQSVLGRSRANNHCRSPTVAEGLEALFSRSFLARCRGRIRRGEVIFCGRKAERKGVEVVVGVVL